MSGRPCQKCGGTTWALGPSGAVVRCECFHAVAISRRIHASKLPMRYHRCSLDEFVTYENAGLMRALTVTRKFVQAFPAAEKGLCFIGPPGIGKTHLAAAALRHAIEEKGATGLFYDVRELLKLIRSTFREGADIGEYDVLKPAMTVDILVLDDLGAEKPSEWVQETLTHLINARYSDRRITIVTTNYEDLPEGEAAETLQTRVGARLHSRLHEMCEFLEFDGGDYRFLPPNGGASDLAMLWKEKASRRKRFAPLPSRAGVARAHLKPRAIESTGSLELKWPGGKFQVGR